MLSKGFSEGFVGIFLGFLDEDSEEDNGRKANKTSSFLLFPIATEGKLKTRKQVGLSVLHCFTFLYNHPGSPSCFFSL